MGLSLLSAIIGLTVVGQFAVAVSPALVERVWNGAKYDCKCYHGDACWPSASAWSALNQTVDGNLVADVPPGAVCYHNFTGPLGTVKTYNAAACANVTASWESEQWAIEQPAAALWSYFSNETCRPTTQPDDACTLGYYPVYAIVAKTHAHIKAGVDFARENNVRLVVRNTGHDFLGRSTGWGSLVINTHGFREYNFTASYAGPGGYRGPAVTIGAGTQARDFLKICHAQKPPLAVVTGECPTVGISGGIVQGGGHGPWTPLKGFMADNALEFQVLTANGSFVVANAESNADLYWALRGGGPGTYGVVLSTTYATFRDLPSAGMILNINSTHTNDSALFWAGVTAFHSHANRLVEAGLYVYYELFPGRLHVQPILGINQTAAQLTSLVAPLLRELDTLGLRYSATAAANYLTFFDLYLDLFEDEGAGATALTGGWTFVKDDVATNNRGIVDAFRSVLDGGAIVLGHMWDGGSGIGAAPGSNAINPVFRNASDKVIVALPLAPSASLDEKARAQHKLTNVLDEALRKAGPRGCAYVNEADPLQPNWQQVFWGTNYQRLYDIRKRWDPDGLFYAVSTPGTEAWEQIEHGTRLCKKID